MVDTINQVDVTIAGLWKKMEHMAVRLFLHCQLIDAHAMCLCTCDVQQYYGVLEEFLFGVEFEDVRRMWATYDWPNRIDAAVERCKVTATTKQHCLLSVS